MSAAGWQRGATSTRCCRRPHPSRGARRRMFGTQSDISANRGGMAAGRDIVGIPPEHLPAIIAAATASHERLNSELQASVAELERQLGANREQVLGFFRIIGEADIE